MDQYIGLNLNLKHAKLKAEMGRKRKTRQEKIILQLKRQLANQNSQTASPSSKSKPSQEAILVKPKIETPAKKINRKAVVSSLSEHPSLIKKDILKTLALTLIIVSLEIVLYLKLR